MLLKLWPSLSRQRGPGPLITKDKKAFETMGAFQQETQIDTRIILSLFNN